MYIKFQPSLANPFSFCLKPGSADYSKKKSQSDIIFLGVPGLFVIPRMAANFRIRSKQMATSVMTTRYSCHSGRRQNLRMIT